MQYSIAVKIAKWPHGIAFKDPCGSQRISGRGGAEGVTGCGMMVRNSIG